MTYLILSEDELERDIFVNALYSVILAIKPLSTQMGSRKLSFFLC